MSKAAAKKKIKRNVARAVANIKASYNNTHVSITDAQGEVIAAGSAGIVGFKGTRKSTPFAATRAAEHAAQNAVRQGVKEVLVRVRGAGSGRESAIRALASAGLNILAIEDC